MNGREVDEPENENVTSSGDAKPTANVAVQKVLGFFAQLPAVSKEVALKVAEQLPELRKVANKALSSFENMYKHTLDKNENSQEHGHKALQDIRDVLKDELKEADLTFEQKKEIYVLLKETAKDEFAKDSENKQLLDTWLKSAGAVAVAALALCIVLVGAKNNDA